MDGLKSIFEEMMEDISDIYFIEGEKVSYRKHLYIDFLEHVVSREEIEVFLNEIEKTYVLEGIYKNYNIDFSFRFGRYRFRSNLFLDRGRYALIMRKIEDEIKDINGLCLPTEVETVCNFNSGIVFITGPTGSGKSTTMASLIENINLNMKKHIITIENPIEQVFENKKSVINQREILVDVKDFSSGVISSLRQDPDIIVIGEVRDIETMSAAMMAAETGHLCICTLHTIGAANSIERVIGMYPKSEQDAIRFELSLVLRAILSQQLLIIEENNTEKIRPVVEFMISDKSISNMIKENKINQISNYIMTNKEKGMISMDKTLIELYKNKKIKIEQVIEKSIDKDFVRKNI